MRRYGTLFLLLLLLFTFPALAETDEQLVQSVEPDASTRVELLLRDGAYIVRRPSTSALPRKSLPKTLPCWRAALRRRPRCC